MSKPKSNKKPAIFFVAKEREPLFSKKNRGLLKDPRRQQPHYGSSIGYLFRLGHYRAVKACRCDDIVRNCCNGSQ